MKTKAESPAHSYRYHEELRARVHDSSAGTHLHLTWRGILEETETPREDVPQGEPGVKIFSARCEMMREKTATEASDMVLVRSSVSAVGLRRRPTSV